MVGSPSLLEELAATLGLPTEGLRSLSLTVEEDGGHLEAGFSAAIPSSTLRTVAYRIQDRCLVTPQLVHCPWGSVDPENGAAYRPDGSYINLTPKERELLQALASKPGRVLTRRELLVAAWGIEFADEQHYLRGVIAHLRQKLGDRKPWRFIEGITGGYVLRTA